MSFHVEVHVKPNQKPRANEEATPSVLVREELNHLLHGDVDSGTNIILSLVKAGTG